MFKMSLLISIALVAQTAFGQYSTADSTLYWSYPDANGLVHFRITNGGATMERTASSPPPGLGLFMTDGTPGNLYAVIDSSDGFSYVYRSHDRGDSWSFAPNVPYYDIEEVSAGTDSGECWVSKSGGWAPDSLLVTSNSWDTYETIPVNQLLNGGQDSLLVFTLSHSIGTLYGVRWFSDSRICISSDTGQTWSVGEGYYPSQSTYGVNCGAVDELWWQMGTQVYVALDTGRTTLGPIFQAHLPDHPPPFNWGWHTGLVATNLPGEAYMIATWDNWPLPPPHWVWIELVVYHIRDYGAVVDSFYYSGYDLDFENSAVQPSPVPSTFNLSAYPNPFNSSIRFEWTLPPRGEVIVEVTDILGRKVWNWTGFGQTILWNAVNSSGSNAASGRYFVRIQQGLSEETIPIILLK